MTLPWPGYGALQFVLAALGAGALTYAFVVLRRTLRQRAYRPVAEDWIWHVLLPAAAYAGVLVAGVSLPSGADASAGQFITVGGASLLLLCIGIHNAWDTVAYLTVSSIRRDSAGQPPAYPPPAPMTRADPETVTVRPAAEADLPVVGRLGALLVRMHHGFDPVRFLSPMDRIEELYASFIGSQLSDQRKLVLVAERNAAVVGYVYAGLEGADYMALRGPAGALYDIVVDPAHRQRGTGRRLLDAAIAALKERGAPMVVLSTAQQNEPAQRLFARAGFRPTMIEMTKDLTRV